MADPIFQITDPKQGDILVYDENLGVWINVPEPPRLTRIRISCSTALMEDGRYHFVLGQRYNFVVEIIGTRFISDITVTISLQADGDFPLINQFEPSNSISDTTFQVVVLAGQRYGVSTILFNGELDPNQGDEVYGKLFTSLDLPVSIILYDDGINQVPFVLSNQPINSSLNRLVYSGYSNFDTVPTLDQLTDGSDSTGTYRFISQYLTNPINSDFTIVCDSPLLQSVDKYYWVIAPSFFTFEPATLIFDNIITLPYDIDGTYSAYVKRTVANYLLIRGN